jgi:hypothetical protein
MSATDNEDHLNQKKLLERIEILEKRLVKVESMLQLEWVGDRTDLKTRDTADDSITVDTAESHIVEYGLAWLGSVVFSFGIIFLMSFTEGLGYPGLSRIVAYLATALLILFSYFYRKSFPILTNVLNICSALLLYYITVRLYFFLEQPIVSQKAVVLSFIFIIIGLQFYKALRKNSEFAAVMGVSLCISTAIFSDSTYLSLPILILVALISLFFFYSKAWWRLHIYSLFLVYFTHLLWFYSNPIMGHHLSPVESPQHNILFLIGYVVIFSTSIFIPKEKLPSNTSLISISIWNALLFSLLLILIIPVFYRDHYIAIFSTIAFFCLLYAVVLKIKGTRNFAPATYAVYGFMAMSIALYYFSGLPDAYLLLVVQSFLVVSMALWFRSKIIVVANAFLFVFILLIYLTTSEYISIINFAFAITALATARILNWQKERLTLKADIFRNTYLILAFFMILFGLNEALPSQYVTLSWTATAFAFFFLSILLRNIKYRYLSILTIVVTGGHLFFVDLGQMSTGFRVIAFLVFAMITIGVSLYYTKRIRKK